MLSDKFHKILKFILLIEVEQALKYYLIRICNALSFYRNPQI